MSTPADIRPFRRSTETTRPDLKGQSTGQEPGKGVLVPVSENVEGRTVLGTVKAEPFGCAGPNGLWPCVLPFGHGEDHVPVKNERALVAELERIRAQRDELRSIVTIAKPLLADWPFVRGGALRHALLVRIEKALEIR